MSGYRVEELLGTGSSGDVWRGRVNATGAAVALKRIWLSDTAQRSAALSEAAMLSSLDHPHLMRLHELRHVGDDAIVLVLDLAAGGSLAALLARRGRLTVGEVVTAVAPIGAALAYAHHSGVVHGDVSPANVLFTDIGLPLLADLGVARLLGDAAPVRTTPAYADPTVTAGCLPGPTSDVFMLGGVALHALTGSPPWPGSTPDEVLAAAACGEQPDFAARLRRAGVPEPVVEVVTRALSVEPLTRSSAADFALDLRHAAEPVAVELSAGRGRRAPVVASTGGRAGSWPLEPVATAGPQPEASAAPVVPFVGQPPLTYGVRAPSPFGAGRHSAAGSPARRGADGRRARIAVRLVPAAALAGLGVAAAVVWWPSGGGGQQVSPTTDRPTTTQRPHPTTPARVIDAASAGAVLRRLDAARAAAFATRDPDLLARVYASPQLLARDRALLTSIVPAGCVLRGVHTRFDRVAVSTLVSARVVVRVRTTIAPSTLVCAGTASGRAAGAPPTDVRVELVRVRDEYLIADQRRA